MFKFDERDAQVAIDCFWATEAPRQIKGQGIGYFRARYNNLIAPSLEFVPQPLSDFEAGSFQEAFAAMKDSLQEATRRYAAWREEWFALPWCVRNGCGDACIVVNGDGKHVESVSDAEYAIWLKSFPSKVTGGYQEWRVIAIFSNDVHAVHREIAVNGVHLKIGSDVEQTDIRGLKRARGDWFPLEKE